MSVGLRSIAPEVDRLIVQWERTNMSTFNGDFGLYISSTRSGLFSTTPILVDINLDSFEFTGLIDGTEYFVGLGLTESKGDPLVPTGEPLSVRLGSLYYVDQSAPSTGADGLSPASAFPLIFPAIITAFLNGGGNVLVRAGTYLDTSLPILAGVDIYGGYSADFQLENRDPELRPTRLMGSAGSSIMSLEAIGSPQRVDGFRIDGLGASSNGIDLDQTPAQLTNLKIRNCARGIRLRSANIFDPTTVNIAGVRCELNRLEGLSLQGTFNLTLEGSTFESNGQEGLQFGPWMAPSGEAVSLEVRDCRFLANGAEGFDVDLSAVPVLGAGGRFDLNIEDCDFDQNALAGCLVDVDFETSPAWRMELSIRGSQALANGTHGFALDIDSSSVCNLHRLHAEGNRQDGLSVTSETYASMVLVSSSSFIGNLGYGARSSLGNVGLALSHCLLAGNGLGGLLDALAPATLSSSAAHLQFAPFGTGYLHGSLNLPDSPAPFISAPLEYRTVTAQSGGSLTLDSVVSSGLGQAVELGSDRILRVLDSSVGATIQVTPASGGLALPALFSLYPTADSIDLDFSPSAGSSLLGAGMAPPFSAALDAGPLGSPSGGTPGVEALLPRDLFWVSAQVPAWGQPIGASAELRISFRGGIPDPASLTNGFRGLDALGSPLTLSASLLGSELVFQAPAGGWQRGDQIELHASITAAGNATALTPITLLVGAD